MGIFEFALKGNYKRFYNDLKEISKKNGKPAWFMFLDTALMTVLLGSGLQDYLNYRFYEKSFAERKTYVTIGSLDKATEILGNIKWSSFISNKLSFHKNYGKFTKREYFNVNEDSFENFEKFLDRHAAFVYKPQIGLGGHEVTRVVTAEITDRKAFYEQAKEYKACIEELVVQHPDWEKLAPGSINTLRVMTGAVDGRSWLIFSAARLGTGKTIADNFHQGGSAVMIDMEKGILVGNAYDKKLHEHETSRTGIKFDGYQVPYWDQIKEMTLEAALVNDEIHLVGWDVAITPNGPLIIEGNRACGFDLVQVLLKKGTQYMLDDLLEEVRKAKAK